MKVEFEHRLVAPGPLQVTLGSRPVPEPLARQLAGRIRVTRWVVLLAGAAAVAYATQRSGVSLWGALCIFGGALPVLWVAGWLTGAGLHMRRTVKQFEAQLDSGALQGQVEAGGEKEHVAFELLEGGLQVTRAGRSPTLVGFQRVGMQRLGPEVLVVNVEGEPFQVPRAAFPDAGAFDAFCLALQGRVWNAERS
jgi:hypothetical protein